MVPRFTPVADHALLVTFGDAIDDASHEAVLALDQRLSDDPPAGMIQAVPALVNLLVEFDPLATTHDAIRAAVAARLGGGPSANQGTVRRVEVCYDGNLAPDLCALADATGLTLEGVINAHLSGDYRVMMYGFSPGYAYMAGVPDAIQVPRKRAAVRDVPAGSVIVAGPQCLITT
ncbi:MAG: allophanate hydrolase subunit 1, partial [Pseudomonadota bacterium]